MTGPGAICPTCWTSNEVADMPESNRFEALVLLLMSIISIVADLLSAV
jgi:hypothetical protein